MFHFFLPIEPASKNPNIHQSIHPGAEGFEHEAAEDAEID